MLLKSVIIYLFILISNETGATFIDYFQNVGSYLGWKQEEATDLQEGFQTTVPYEVSEADEKFIAHAIELTGVAVSDLDSCTHRVVLKLRSDCQRMNDEEISKLAVALLNCQSYVEGRQIYPCTEQMSIKECTSGMDAIAWNSYHLMSNRANAVCYSIRQIQFRGLTEHTVNKLMHAARNQLKTLEEMKEDQENVRDVARETLHTVTQGQAELVQQQEDLMKAQLHGQLTLEDNIKRLGDEKQLIIDSQNQLAEMTQQVQMKLTQASQQIEDQVKETNLNHKELLQDLISIQEKAQAIFQKIEDSTQLLFKQSQIARQQYEATIKQLSEVNNTVHSLVSLVGGTKQALEERLNWLTQALGGTDDAVERLYLVIWHFAFLLIAMIACAFLGTRTSTRLAVIILIPINLALALYELDHAVNAVVLGAYLTIFITVQTLLINGYNYFYISKRTQIQLQEEVTQNSIVITPTQSTAIHEETIPEDYTYQEPEYISSPTPPLSRSGYYESRSRSRTPSVLNNSTRVFCKAITRLGKPCKATPIAGRDYCHRHLKDGGPVKNNGAERN